MSNGYIHDRGCGPQIVGRRITVFNLVPYFRDPDTTEAMICQIYELSPDQVAAARAYVLNHFDEVMSVHRRIEARNAAGNPPEVVERMKRTHEAFEAYRHQFNERKCAEALCKEQQKVRGLLADENIGGLLAPLHRLLTEFGLLILLEALGIEFATFSDLSLSPGMDDRPLWDFCQRDRWVLLTDNRNEEDSTSLEATLAGSWKPGCLPVLTIGTNRDLSATMPTRYA